MNVRLRFTAAVVAGTLSCVCQASPPSGRLIAWGSNGYGQCDVPADLTQAVAVVAGYGTTSAIDAHGQLWCWGNMFTGSTNTDDCGYPSYSDCNFAGQLTPSFSIYGSGSFITMWRDADGNLQCGGVNYAGECSIPSARLPLRSVRAGDNRALVVDADGRAIIAGQHNRLQIPAELPPLLDAASGRLVAIGLTESGDVVTWRRSIVSGEACPYHPPADLRNVVAVDVVNRFGQQDRLVALTDDGDLHIWPPIPPTLPQIPDDLEPIQQISAGHGFVLALGASGTTYCFSTHGSFCPSPPQDLPPATWIEAGHSTAVAQLVDGSFRWWGSGATPLPPELSPMTVGIRRRATSYDDLILIDNDGRLTCWPPCDSWLPYVEDVRLASIEGFDETMVGLTTDGRPWLNIDGECPSGNCNDVLAPEAPFRVLAVTYGAVLGIDDAGRLHTWGNGTNEFTSPPDSIRGESVRSAWIVPYMNGGGVLYTDGSVECWGGVHCPSSAGDPLAIVDATGSIAVTEKGTVLAWSYDVPAIVPEGLPPIRDACVYYDDYLGEVAAVLDQDGQLHSWLLSDGRELPVPSHDGVVVTLSCGKFHVAAIVAPCTPAAADLDANCVVDGSDLSLLLLSWGRCTGCKADLDGNGIVDGADLGRLLLEWTIG